MTEQDEPRSEAVETSDAAPSEEIADGDWRVQFETRVASDVPAAYPGGPAHKAGARIVVTTLGPRRGAVPLGFETPASAALALDIAVRATREGESLRAQIRTAPVVSPSGLAENVTADTTTALFDFFEQALVALAFSYQAVESLANEEIGRVVASTVRVQTRQGWQDLDAQGCQRWLSTSEKLVQILPDNLKLISPKKRRWWSAFRELESLRNDSIHLKSHRAYPRSDPPEASVFHELLAVKRLSIFPKTAVDVAEYFYEGRERPRWLRAARDQVDVL